MTVLNLADRVESPAVASSAHLDRDIWRSIGLGLDPEPVDHIYPQISWVFEVICTRVGRHFPGSPWILSHRLPGLYSARLEIHSECYFGRAGSPTRALLAAYLRAVQKAGA